MNTKQTVLLTGGRAPATLHLAWLFKHQGHRVLVAETHSFHLTKLSRYVDDSFKVAKPRFSPEQFIEDLKQIVIRDKVDLLVPTCEEVFYVSKGKEELSKYARICVDSLEKLGALHNKWTFNQKVDQYALNAPATKLITQQSDISMSLQALSKYKRLVLKPAYSRFASKVQICDNHSDQLHQALSSITPTPTSPWVLQEFVGGQEYCSYAVANNGKLLAHVTYAHEFKAGHGAGICFEAINHPEILKWVSEFVQKENFTGQIAFDFIEDFNGVLFPLECNPRATSGIHLFTPEHRLDLKLLGDNTECVRPLAGTRGMIGLIMIIYGLPAIRSFKQLALWLKIFRRSSEVVAKWRDPAPFFYQFVTLGYLFLKGIKHNISLLEASTQDIEWNGET